MTLASFYVLVSRVRELSGLRLLQHDAAGLSAVSQLSTDEYLHGWERGYSEATGLWDDALAARAMHELRGARDAAKKAAAAAKQAAATAKKAAADAQRATQRQATGKRPATHPPSMALQANQRRKVPRCTACNMDGHSASSPLCTHF